MITKLDQKQRQELQDAVQEAFPSRTKFEIALKSHCGIDLDVIVSEKENLRETIHKVLKHAESSDKVEELLGGLRNANPGNKRLRDAVRNYTVQCLDDINKLESQGKWNDAVRKLESLCDLKKRLLTLPEEEEWWKDTESQYGNVEYRLSKAKKQKRLTELYNQASDAETSSNWSLAIELHQQIVAEEPTYRDAQLRLKYASARAAEEHHDWAEAVNLYQQIVAEEPTYRDAQARLERARRQLHLAEWDAQARAAEEHHDWAEAVKFYQQIVAEEPTYRDAQARLKQARRQLRLAQWDAQARAAEEGGDWRGAVECLKQIVAEDPNCCNAQLRLKYASARAAEERHDWAEAVNLYQQIVAEEPTYRDAQARLEQAGKQRAAVYEQWKRIAIPLIMVILIVTIVGVFIVSRTKEMTKTDVSTPLPEKITPTPAPSITITGFRITQGDQIVEKKPGDEISLKENTTVKIEALLDQTIPGLAFSWMTSKEKETKVFAGDPAFLYVVPAKAGPGKQWDLITVKVVSDQKLLAEATIFVDITK